MIKTYVLTNNNHIWLMRGFAHLWQKYTDRYFNIFYGDKYPYQLPKVAFSQSLGQCPANRWSNSLLDMLDNISEDYFILMLEDFWLYEYADFEKIDQLGSLMSDDILRIDLSGNRASYKSAYEIASSIVETPPGTPYQMSFQAAIWHKENMGKVLRKNENPWQAEVNGSERVKNLRVLGTKPAVLKYQPVWRSKQKRWQLEKIKTVDLEHMKMMGWLDVPE